MTAGVPSRVCDRCGEWLPHWCAPLIIITRQRWTGRRIVTITDRNRPGLHMGGRAGGEARGR